MNASFTVTILCLRGEKFPNPLCFVDNECINKCKRCGTHTYMVFFALGKHHTVCQVEDNGKLGRRKVEWFLN